MDIYYFKIKCYSDDKFEEIEFSLEDNFGDIDGLSFNPTTGWTGYTQFDQGWSEQDEELNELLGAIKDFSQSPQLIEILYDNSDDRNPIKVRHYCDMNVSEPKEHSFILTIQDVEYGPN